MSKNIEDSEDFALPSSSNPVNDEDYDGETYFERLSSDAVLEIFKWLPIEDTVKLTRESSFLNDAVRLHMKIAMMGLRRHCAEVLPWVQDKLLNLPLNQDHLRFDLVKSVSIVRYLSKEIELLFAIVWRLRDDHQAWTELMPHLAPVIQEFDDAITSHYDLNVRRHVLDGYWMRQLLKQWHLFMDKVNSGLEERLYAMASRKTPFEIRVIDLLMCAPSFNFQLALKRLVTGGAYYNVYGFFKTPNLKAVCQVPNVFNAELNIRQKKRTLSTYLRETVQRENICFLSNLSNRIHDLELAFLTFSPSEQDRLRLLNRLDECYQLMHVSPYAEVMKKSKYRVSKELYEEYYVRCSDQNMNFTGLHCVVVVPLQEVWNLPLVVPFLRGRRQKLLDHFETVEMEGSADLSNLFPPFAHRDDSSSSSTSQAEVRGSEEMPRMQLIIHYRESYVAAPSEIVINIGYDNDETCYLTFHNLVGELLIPQDPQPRLIQPGMSNNSQ